MAKLFTFLFCSLLISFAVARVSPSLSKYFSFVDFEQADCELSEKFGEAETGKSDKTFKNTEFLYQSYVFCFETYGPTYTSYVFTPTIPYSILEIPKRPPQKLS